MGCAVARHDASVTSLQLALGEEQLAPLVQCCPRTNFRSKRRANGDASSVMARGQGWMGTRLEQGKACRAAYGPGDSLDDSRESESRVVLARDGGRCGRGLSADALRSVFTQGVVSEAPALYSRCGCACVVEVGMACGSFLVPAPRPIVAAPMELAAQ